MLRTFGSATEKAWMQLLHHLTKYRNLRLGTTRRNRTSNCKVPTDRGLKRERGYSTEFVTDLGGIDISNVIWKDNKFFTVVYSGVIMRVPIRRDIDRYRRFDSRSVWIFVLYVVSLR